jgi:putative SOS response-associated peptidase YedK
MAGIFERSQADAPATCCILTTGANARVAEVHDRMPVLLDPAAVRDWLDPRTPRDILESLLVPAPLEAMLAFPVSARVNRADHDDPSLTRPIGVTPETHEPRETDA